MWAICNLAAQTIGIFGVLALTEPPKSIISLPAPLVRSAYKQRKLLAFLGALFLGLSFYGNRKSKGKSLAPAFISSGIYFFLTALSYLSPRYERVSPDNLESLGEFRDMKAADLYIADEEEVLISFDEESNGKNAPIRVFPIKWLSGPAFFYRDHTDQPVLLTYCAQSGMGQGFVLRRSTTSPSFSDLSMDEIELPITGLTSAEGNLLLYEQNTGRTIKQLHAAFHGFLTARGREGEPICGFSALPLPTRKMSWGAFKKSYGCEENLRAWVAPPLHWREWWRNSLVLAERWLIGRFKNKKPDSKIIGSISPSPIYGLVVNGKALAFTRDFLRKHPGPIEIDLAGRAVKLEFDHELSRLEAEACEDSITSMENASNAGLPVSKDKQRLNLACLVSWHAWRDAFPDSTIDEV